MLAPACRQAGIILDTNSVKGKYRSHGLTRGFPSKMLDLNHIESFYPESLRPFKRNLLREYLQYKILEVIFSSSAAQKLYFMGGTAIHIVHQLARFSEDLDFDNRGLDKSDFSRLALLIQRKLKLEGYTIEIKTSFDKAYSVSIKIADILYENKLSLHKQEKMFIKLDSEPQNFSYRPEQIILNKFDVFTKINVVPEDILLSQKIYAIFMRKRPMGRDFYDTIFLFGKAKPNISYLDKKLKIKNTQQLKERLIKKCKDLDFRQLAEDVKQFLFVPSDAKKVELFCEYIEHLE